MAWAENASMSHVKVCIPHFGNVTLEWARHTFAPLDLNPQTDFAKQTILMRGLLNIDTERNELVKEALKDAKTTHIFFLDTDIIFEDPEDPNQALRMLLSCDASVASGLYRARQKTGFNYAMWKKAKNQEGYTMVRGWTEGSNWIKVDAIGLGCCLFKREVFEKIPHPWFKWDTPQPSEDFHFCQKLLEHGYEIRVLTAIKCAHIGTLKVRNDGTITTLDV